MMQDDGSVALPQTMLPQLCLLTFGDDAVPSTSTGIIAAEVAAWQPQEADQETGLIGTIVYLKNGKVLFVPVAPGEFEKRYCDAARMVTDAYWQLTH